jgi:small nuclear ribonucleoprotein (snRNP)-like protein
MTNTGKGNGRKGRPRKNKGTSDSNKFGEEGNKENNPSDSEDGGENHEATSVPPNNIELLRNHIEMQDEELMKQRELLIVVLKQNEELANTIKALQEHMNLNTDTNKVKCSHQISINVDSKNQKGRYGSNTNTGPSNPRVTFHSHIKPEPEY